jgi:hypothetical protein
MAMRDHFDLTPAQYHAGLDKLWEALGLTSVQNKDVFILAAERIRELEAALELIKITPKNKDLLQLADNSPAPQSWYDEE